jgi:hypothetical protein
MKKGGNDMWDWYNWPRERKLKCKQPAQIRIEKKKNIWTQSESIEAMKDTTHILKIL